MWERKIRVLIFLSHIFLFYILLSDDFSLGVTSISAHKL